jgi:hypothetical protein
MPDPRPPVPRNQLDKAGSRVRRAAAEGAPVPDDVRGCVAAFRGWHLDTVKKVESALIAVFHDPPKLTQESLPITRERRHSKPSWQPAHEHIKLSRIDCKSKFHGRS